MGRTRKRDVPGPDWRVDLATARAGGLCALYDVAGVRGLPLVVEIGFGGGGFLQRLARERPDVAHLGIESSQKRVEKAARKLSRSGLVNVRLVQATAEEVVRELLPPESVEAFWINYPDPWPKRRHHRRRLLQPAFVRELARRLRPGGKLCVATDHEDYADAIDAVLREEPSLANAYAPYAYVRDVAGRPATRYELEWRAEGRPLHFFEYRRLAGAAPG